MIRSTCLVVVTVTIIATMYTGKGTELDSERAVLPIQGLTR